MSQTQGTKRKTRPRSGSNPQIHAAEIVPAKRVKLDLVDLVCANKVEELERELKNANLADYRTVFAKDKSIETSTFSERQRLANENPLYVAAKIGREDCARLLLAAGWKMSEDVTMVGEKDESMAYFTPIGIAYEKKNSVMDIFLEQVKTLEQRL